MGNNFEEMGNAWNKRNDVVAGGQNEVERISFQYS